MPTVLIIVLTVILLGLAGFHMIGTTNGVSIIIGIVIGNFVIAGYRDLSERFYKEWDWGYIFRNTYYQVGFFMICYIVWYGKL